MARSRARRNKASHWLVLGIMLANLLVAGFTPAAAQGSSPSFSARPVDNHLSGWEWQPNSSVNITIDGYPTSASTDDGGNFELNLDGFDLQAGQTVTVSDGSSTKTHTVTSLAVTAVDAGANTVSGTAVADSLVQVSICDEGGCANREETADGDGSWTANFSVAGDQPGEEDTRDIQPSTGGDSGQWDDDGDSTNVGWQAPNPRFEARPEEDSVDGWEWPAGSMVTLSIDDPGNGIGEDYGDTQEADEWGNVSFGLPGMSLLQVGNVVTLSNGPTTKGHTVVHLTVDGVDPDEDTIWGTAAAGSEVTVWTHDGNAYEQVTATDGNWSVDLTDQVDLVPGSGGVAVIYDPDWDSTAVYWWIANPRFEVRPEEDQIDGWEWPAETAVNLIINGGDPYPQTTDGDGNVSFGLQGTVDLQVGDVVTLSDGATTKGHTVVHLTVDDVDPDADTVSGTADAGSRITVWTHQGGAGLQVTADSGGNWSADLSGQADLQPGSGGGAAVHDVDQDSTAVYWWIAELPFPHFEVVPDEDSVNGWEWPAGTEVDLTINGGGSYTQIADEWGNVSFGLQGTVDLQVGDVVTLSDGPTTKEHIVVHLTVDGVDPGEDTIWGTAAAGSRITVWTHDGWANAEVEANEEGDWLVDLTDQGDLQPGSGGGAAILDVDQDSTAVYWRIPNPSFSARPVEDRLSGWQWQPNSSVNITIDGYPTNAPTDEWGNFDLNLDGFDLQPDHYVTVTDGSSTKHHTVTNLAVTAVDADANTVSGTAVAGSLVQVSICDDGGCANREETADGDGFWTADFSVAGDQPWEEDTRDIQPGTGGDSGQWDEDGDGTQISWYLPNPTFAARPDQDRVDGWEWPEGASVTLDIDDPATPENPDYSATQMVGVAEWDPSQTYVDFNFEGLFDLQPGHEVTLSDEVTTKHHTVISLTVTTVDAGADTVSGATNAGFPVQVWICDEGGCANREEPVDEGLWTVNFSVPGDQPWEQEIWDIQPGTGGEAAQWDDDGDSTQIGWYLPNPTFAARPDQDRVDGWEWPFDALVTLTIDDPATPENPDYTAEQTVGVAEWDPSKTYVEFRFDGLFNLQPLHEVTLSDGATTKEHTVTNLAITEVNADANTVSGTAESGSTVDVWSCDYEDCANRHLVVVDGNWIADLGNPGTEDDEQYTIDIVNGTSGDAEQRDDDGDSTRLRWEEVHPRVEVSYEHDWIQIRGFTAGGQVTYTIFDYEGGHELFGPRTGPVDSHGDGWISSNLFHTDLIPGMYVTAMDESSGEEASILIQNVNLDYISAVDDIAFGTAEPNSTIELNISEIHDHGFSLTVPVDGDGNWYVDLAAAGHPIAEYRHANANLYDAEGDNITAQNPRIHAQVATDSFGVDNFSKNADVTLTLYDSPGEAVVLYGPEIHHTDRSGNAWVNLWEEGIVLEVGHYIVAEDHFLGFTKTLEIEPYTFDEMNVADDYVSGTSSVGEWVELHVESLFSNWGMDALTDEFEQWYRDYGIEDYDITEQMWGYGWAIDEQGNWSEDHITGLPNIEASPADDWISGFNFTPNRPVWIGIYDYEGGELLAEIETMAGGNTQFQVRNWEHHVDLQPGMHIHVVDTETLKSSSLTLAFLTFDGVNYDTDTAYGHADPDTQVVVRADWFFDHYEVVATVGPDGIWSADFGVDLTPDWSLRALVFDAELDATVADAPRPPEFAAAFDQDWVSGNNWSRDSQVQIEIFEADTMTLLDTVEWGTDAYGRFHVNLWGYGLDLQPGMYLVVTDSETGRTKETTVVNLTIDNVDPDNELVSGSAPGDTQITVNCWNDRESLGFDLFSEAGGAWVADYGAHDFDVTPDTSCDARIYDEDNDATQANWHVENPNFAARPVDDAVEGWQWPLDAEITVTIEQDGDPDPECTGITSVIIAPWDDRSTWFRVELQGECDLVAGDTVVVTDGATEKTHVVTDLEVHGADAESNTVFGTAEPESEVRVWLHEESNSELELTADGGGNWTADYADWLDLQPGTGGAAVQQDDDGDQTWIDWEVPSRPFRCEPGLSISGKVTESDGVTPLQTATVHIDDWFSGEQLYYAEADEFGLYSCGLPDGDYLVWADGTGTDGTGYSREYYEETIFEHAAMLHVEEGTTHEGVDLTLDTPVVIYDHFTFNLTDPVVSDLAVRQAIAYGTDRALIIAETFPASPMMHTFLNPDHWAADYGAMPQYGFDPVLARQILTTAGWVDEDGDGIRERDGERLHIVYVTTQLPPDHFRHTVYEIFVENMADIGVEVEVVMTSSLWDRVFQQHDFGITQFAWVIDVNDDTWPGMIFASEHEYNAGLYSREQVDEALKGALDYGTRAAKLPLLLVAQELLMEDLATLPLLMRVTDNHPPTIDAVTGPVDPVSIYDQPVSVEVTFSDPDEGDTHTVTWEWGDGSSDTQDAATSPASADHTYAEPGVYPVWVTVTDGDGARDKAVYEYIVIYDPEGGFVTGGGWIWSPAGAYTDDPTLEGKASFGFVSKYKKGANVPEGQTQFQFKAGDLSFHSDSYEWLVVAGAKAMFKGVGTINGAGNYGFMLSAIDGALIPSTDVDLFRIKIWDRDNGDVVVYDNLMGASDDADPTTALGGGNIVVHKVK